MATVYCEFCGEIANDAARTPDRLVAYVHNVGKDVIRCWKHRRTSKMHHTSRTHSPLTGERVQSDHSPHYIKIKGVNA